MNPGLVCGLPLLGKRELVRLNPSWKNLLLGKSGLAYSLGLTETRARACCSRGGGEGRAASCTAALYPPRKMEYMTASAQPMPKAKPRKNPMIAPQGNVTGFRMAHHVGSLGLQVEVNRTTRVRRDSVCAYAFGRGVNPSGSLDFAGVSGVSRIRTGAAIPLQQQAVAGETGGNVTPFGEVTGFLPTLYWMPYLRKAHRAAGCRADADAKNACRNDS